MQQERLNLYFMDMKYVRDLHKADDRVQSVSPLVQKPNCSGMLEKRCNNFKKLEKVLE